MTCSNCQAEIHPKARLCLTCGAAIPQRRKGRLLWGLTLCGSILGGFIVIGGVGMATGAPQEASAAAIGVAFAVIPYCLARAAAEIGQQ